VTAADKFLAEVRARSAAATPGPWERDCNDVYAGDLPVFQAGTENGHADCDFAARARTDVDRLVAMVEAARKALKGQWDIADECADLTGRERARLLYNATMAELDRIAGGRA
jgi:hypothetical protein